MEWTTDEIDQLHAMLRQKRPISDICDKLHRSRNSVIRATHKILLQQLIVHNASDVAANYGMTVDELSNQVAHDKFYVPVVSESHEMIPKSLYIPFAIMCTIGMARFFMVLSQHWTW